jgi:5-formyltetrahydrofolate cyclo-ligase
MDKHNLRQQTKKKRDCLTRERIIRYSALVMKNLKKAVPIAPGSVVLAYISTQSEVRTGPFIKSLIKAGCKVYAPCVRGIHIVPTMINDVKMKRGSYGIMEPSGGKTLRDYKKLDLVIIPGIAFDAHGNRIGFGKGYYDRFLKKIPKKVLKAGVAFECQMVPEIAAENHDINMDLVVTERAVIRTKTSG